MSSTGGSDEDENPTTPPVSVEASGGASGLGSTSSLGSSLVSSIGSSIGYVGSSSGAGARYVERAEAER